MSQYQAALADYGRKHGHWSRTIKEIDEHEHKAWKELLPSKCRLAVYWSQMVLCEVELLPRIIFHALAWLLVLPWFGVSILLAALLGEGSKAQIVRVSTGRRRMDKEAMPCYQRQFAHHAFWISMYSTQLPQLINYNLQHPCEPFFADSADCRVYRPSQPIRPAPPDASCFEGFCRWNCDDVCQHGCATVEVILVQYFRCSFFALSGLRSLHCGACLGPCVHTLCYDPCNSDHTESGHCGCCEPDEIRMRRWVRESHEAKVLRSLRFYDERPHLMRPSSSLLAVATVPAPPTLLPPGGETARAPLLALE